MSDKTFTVEEVNEEEYQDSNRLINDLKKELEHEDEAEEKEPQKTVGAIIVHEKKILLVQRNTEPFKGDWSLPGGLIKPGEGDEAAVIREVKEETGLTVVPNYFGSYSESYDGLGWYAVASIFTCIIEGSTDVGIQDSKEVQDVQWVSYEHIGELDIAFDHKRIINEFLETQ